MPDHRSVGVRAGPAVGAADFRYHRPRHPEEVDDLLAAHPGSARVLAGGTDLLVQVRAGDTRPTNVIDVADLVAVSRVDLSGAELTVGAAAPLRLLRGHREVRRRFAALVDGAACVGSLQIQSRATLVGNLCNASPAADTSPAVLLYEGRVVIRSVRGRRVLPVEEFWRGPRLTSLEPDEWVESVRMRDPGSHGSAYVKLGRTRGVDLALVGVACLVGPDGVRTACASLAPTPRRLLGVDGVLAAGADDQTLDAAVASDVQPISDIRATAAYRLAMTRVCARRAHHSARQRWEAHNP